MIKILVMTPESLRQQEPYAFPRGVWSSEEVSRILGAYGALYCYLGNPALPHPRNDLNEHTLMCCEPELALRRAKWAEILAQQLWKRLRAVGFAGLPDWLIGGAGDGLLVSALAHLQPTCLQATTQAASSGELWRKVHTPRLNGVKPKALCVRTELLDCDSFQLVRQAVDGQSFTSDPVDWLPYCLTLVNASGQNEIAGTKVVSLLELDPATQHYPATECPYCKAGSPSQHYRYILSNPPS